MSTTKSSCVEHKYTRPSCQIYTIHQRKKQYMQIQLLVIETFCEKSDLHFSGRNILVRQQLDGILTINKENKGFIVIITKWKG
jgi:phosphorylcholine metabolism protein LicD